MKDWILSSVDDDMKLYKALSFSEWRNIDDIRISMAKNGDNIFMRHTIIRKLILEEGTLCTLRQETEDEYMSRMMHEFIEHMAEHGTAKDPLTVGAYDEIESNTTLTQAAEAKCREKFQSIVASCRGNTAREYHAGREFMFLKKPMGQKPPRRHILTQIALYR